MNTIIQKSKSFLISFLSFCLITVTLRHNPGDTIIFPLCVICSALWMIVFIYELRYDELLSRCVKSIFIVILCGFLSFDAMRFNHVMILPWMFCLFIWSFNLGMEII